MSGKITITGTIVTKFLEEETRPLPSLTLAKIIFKQHPQEFKDVEHVRTIIRRYRGASGKQNREDLTDKRFIQETGWQGGFVPPESEEQEWEPFVIPKQFKRTGIISDIHVPYHNVQAVTVALEYLAERKIDSLILNGYIIDFYMASDFVKDPRKRNIKYEIDQANRFLDMIDDFLPGVELLYKVGNHEERLERYMFLHAKELLGFDFFKIEELLEARQRKMTVIEDQRIIKLGKLQIVHGHELGVGSNAVNPARNLYMKAKQSALMGHSHVVSEHTEPNLSDEPITCWSTGCLSELHPRYARVNKWSHGFAMVDTEESGEFHVRNYRIYKGKIL